MNINETEIRLFSIILNLISPSEELQTRVIHSLIHDMTLSPSTMRLRRRLSRPKSLHLSSHTCLGTALVSVWNVNLRCPGVLGLEGLLLLRLEGVAIVMLLLLLLAIS